LLCQTKVLLLDEATNALDAEGELAVKTTLRALPWKPTVVVVAHRLSTVFDADRIIMIEKGRVIATGTHAMLLQAYPSYRKLIKEQLVEDVQKAYEDVSVL